MFRIVMLMLCGFGAQLALADTRIVLGTGARWAQDVTVDNVSSGIDEDQSWIVAFERPYSAVADWQIYASEFDTTLNTASGDRLKTRVLQIGGVRWLEQGDFRPYLGATGGVTQLALDNTMTRASMSLFAGLNWDVSSAVAIRTELRWIGTYVNSDTELRCAGGRCVLRVDAGLWRQNEATVQAVFSF